MTAKAVPRISWIPERRNVRLSGVEVLHLYAFIQAHEKDATKEQRPIITKFKEVLSADAIPAACSSSVKL